MAKRTMLLAGLAMGLALLVALFLSYAGQAQPPDIAVYFSRVDDPEAAIIRSLNRAQTSVHIAMYYFTDPDLAQAVVRAHRRGVAVYVYLDRSQVKAKYSQSRYLAQQGVPVRISSNRHIMHNKFAIIDDSLVLTGSYNWTRSAAERNDENLVRIYRPDIAQRYKNRFGYFWTKQFDLELTVALRN